MYLFIQVNSAAVPAERVEEAVEWFAAPRVVLQEGEFREDLYYRLNVVTIPLPPLRERQQDIPALVEHFLHRGGRSASVTAEALTKLVEYYWPGNVRELENTIERALVLAREGVVTANEIVLHPMQNKSGGHWTERAPLEAGWQTNPADLEKSLVERALHQAEGNKSKAAELLGIHRRLLYEKIKEYKLEC